MAIWPCTSLSGCSSLSLLQSLFFLLPLFIFSLLLPESLLRWGNMQVVFNMKRWRFVPEAQCELPKSIVSCKCGLSAVVFSTGVDSGSFNCSAVVCCNILLVCACSSNTSKCHQPSTIHSWIPLKLVDKTDLGVPACQTGGWKEGRRQGKWGCMQ